MWPHQALLVGQLPLLMLIRIVLGQEVAYEQPPR